MVKLPVHRPPTSFFQILASETFVSSESISGMLVSEHAANKLLRSVINCLIWARRHIPEEWDSKWARETVNSRSRPCVSCARSRQSAAHNSVIPPDNGCCCRFTTAYYRMSNSVDSATSATVMNSYVPYTHIWDQRSRGATHHHVGSAPCLVLIHI